MRIATTRETSSFGDANMPPDTDTDHAHDQQAPSFVDHTLAALDEVEAAMTRLDVEKREARRRIAREHRAENESAPPQGVS